MIRMLNRKGAAAYLNVSIATIDRLIATKGIPFYKIKRSVRFKQEQLDEWLDDKCHMVWKNDPDEE